MATSKTKTSASDPLSGYTPAIRRYLEIKAEHPDVLLLYRMGDFYETFFDDAVRANRLIGLTLTSRGTDTKGDPIAMAGIPEKTLDQYLARLVKLGQSVGICEQIGDPKQGPLERHLARIVTPGTLTESELLPQKSNAALMAVHFDPKQPKNIGLAWIVLSNGEFKTAQTEADQLSGEISRIAPSEILVAQEHIESIKALGCSGAVTPLPAWHFSPEHGQEMLMHQFQVQTLSAWGLDEAHLARSACGALLGYIETTQCASVSHLLPPVYELPNQFVGIDAASRRNLELTQTLRGDDGPTLFQLLDQCQSTMGSRLLRHWIHHPLRDTQRVKERQSAIASMLDKPDLTDEINALIRPLPDLERLATRLAMKSIRPKELAALRDALPRLAQMAQRAYGFDCPWLHQHLQSLLIDPSLFARLDKALLSVPATLLRDGDVIAPGYNEELDALRQMRDHAGEFLNEFEQQEKQRTGLNTLRVQYNRLQGFFIEVSRGQADQVPEHYQRRQTLKNSERFTTPELKAYEGKALSAQERSQSLQKELYEQLLVFACEYIPALQQAARDAAVLDVIGALASHASKAGWICPQLKSTPGIELIGARHPVVEDAIEHYTPNDCILVPGRRLLVITGPNMGGKSTYMRSVALIALLTYMGSYVPAQRAAIGPIDRILTRIGASDDLARGRSTFMVEMTEAAAILHQATDSSLVLMDEIGRGTSTFDGLSLAAAMAQELAQVKKSFTLFATHYFELTQLAQTCEEVANVHVSAAESKHRVIFLHEVKEGPANQSYGIAVAQLAGVAPSVIRRARCILKDLQERAKPLQEAQLNLFAQALPEEPAPEPAVDNTPLRELVESIGALDLDDLTPRQALQHLYELKQKAKDML